MNISPPTVILPCLLLLACSLSASCSTEPTIQTEKVTAQPARDLPKPLQDVVVASEDEVPSWTESADNTKTAPEKEASGK